MLPPLNELELGTEELLLAATLEELFASLEELGKADELDGTTELLLGATLEELGGVDELDGTAELLLGSSPPEEDGSTVSTLDDELSAEAFPM